MNLTESQELFIEVGRLESSIIHLYDEMTGHEVEGFDLEGSELEADYKEKINKLRRRRRYLLRKARTAYNKEMKAHNERKEVITK